MRKIKVCNYEILNFEVDPLVYTSTGITRITSAGIFSVLKEILKEKNQEIPYARLKKIFRAENIVAEDAMSFLEKINILGEVSATPYLKKAVIYCDWVISSALIDVIERAGLNQIEVRKLEDVSLQQSDEPALLILATLKLDVQKMQSIYFDLRNKNPFSAISLGFSNGSHFHLTEPHIPRVGNPCAFCTINRVIHYEKMMPSQHQWSKLLEFCSSNDVALPKIESDEFKDTLIMMLLVKVSKKMIFSCDAKTTQDETLQSITIDLENGRTTNVASAHWPICRCLSPEL